MAEAVVDASAVLAVIFEEPGSDQVEAQLPGAAVSTVSLAEVAARLLALGMARATVETVLDSLQLAITPFDADQALATAELRAVTSAAGLSLGARACLALARARQVPALTADSAWAAVADSAAVEVVLIREPGSRACAGDR